MVSAMRVLGGETESESESERERERERDAVLKEYILHSVSRYCFLI